MNANTERWRTLSKPTYCADMIGEILAEYMQIFPEEKSGLSGLLAQLDSGDVMNDRKTLPGHITGGGLVLSPDRTKILLIHHKLFNKWLQPGGHWDPGEASPRDAARREAIEETGVQIAEQLVLVAGKPLVPLDVGAHPIPARPEKQEALHTHYDFRYVFVAAATGLQHADREVFAAEWMSLDDPRTEHIRTYIDKMQRFGILAAA